LFDGIPPTLLSERRKRLVSDGLLERQGAGRRETHAFAPHGRRIEPELQALRDFGAGRMPDGWESGVPPEVLRG